MSKKLFGTWGTQVMNNIDETELAKKPNNKKLLTPEKQKLVVLASIIGVVLVAFIIFAITNIINNDYNKAKSYYSKNDTVRIAQLYTTMSDINADKFFDYLEKESQKVNADYFAGSTSYDDTLLKMDKIRSFYKKNARTTNFYSLRSNIANSYLSKKSYEDAELAEQENNHVEAYLDYKKVIKTDPNYSIANEKINILSPVIASQLYEAAKKEYEATNYTNAIDYINRALSYEQYNQDMLKFKDECVSKDWERNRKTSQDLLQQSVQTVLPQ